MEAKGIQTMVNVFTGWVLDVVDAVLTTVLLPVNLILGLLTNDVINPL